MRKQTFEEAISFHGHTCPGLAMGFRVAQVLFQQLAESRSTDEELVAVVENDSCAVDAIQALTGCTFGKGNLIFKDYGKQVYTFINRQTGRALRISVRWTPPTESREVNKYWQRYNDGDRSPEVMEAVKARKAEKIKAILQANDQELFEVRHINVPLPARASIYSSVVCDTCGEKVMEPKARVTGDQVTCIPCSTEDSGRSARE